MRYKYTATTTYLVLDISHSQPSLELQGEGRYARNGASARELDEVDDILLPISLV